MRNHFILFRYLLLLACMVSMSSARAEPLVLNSGTQQVSLLELYTSEGCSSCPPADLWFSKLIDDSRLWREVVPIAFHVDYWDYIGWPDRFAESGHSRRQYDHAANNSKRTVYTPQLVLNGSAWQGWFRRREIELDRNPAPGELRLRIDSGRLEAQFEPINDTPRRLELHVAVLGFGLNSEVKAGENKGRILQHDFVVLAHDKASLKRVDKQFQTQMALPKSRLSAPRTAVATWLSEPGNPRPIQAVGGWL